jgi:putative membrane protein
MKNITINLIINAVSLGAAAWLLGIGHIDPFGLVIAAAVFGLLNSFVMPIIRFFAIPINFVSFGIFNIILNAALLKVVLHYVPTAIGEPIGWFMAICIGGIMGLCNSLLNYFLK